MFEKVYSTKINAFANLIANIWTAILSIVFVPFYLHYIGIEAFGLIGIFSSIQAFIVLLDFGLSPTLNRELARFSALNNKAQEIHNLKRSLEIPNWILAIFIALLLCILTPFLSSFWFQPEELPALTVTHSLLIISISIAIQFSINFYVAGLIGLQKQLMLSIVNVVCGTLRSIGSFVVLAFFSPTIQAFLLWQCLVLLLQVALVILLLNRSLPESQLQGCFQRDLIYKNWRFAAGMTGISIISLILSQTDKLILSKMLNLEMFGYYNLALTISSMGIGMIANSISQAAYPKFSKFVSIGEESVLRNFYHQNCQLLSVALFPIMAILALYSYDILLLWTRNEKIATNTYLLLSLIAVDRGLNALLWLPYFMQLAHGWTKLSLYVNLATIIVITPLMILGVYNYGAVGGTIVWVTINSSHIFIIIHLMHRRILKGEQWKWYIKDFIPPFFVSFCIAGIGKLFLFFNLSSLEMVLRLALISFVTFLFAGMATQTTRNLIFNFLYKRWFNEQT